jgi:transposase
VREGYKAESLAIGNRLRGLLAEFGIVVAKSDLALRRTLPELDQYTALPDEFRELIGSMAAHWAQVRTAIDACDARIDAHARMDERCVRLRAIVGIGPILLKNSLFARRMLGRRRDGQSIGKENRRVERL